MAKRRWWVGVACVVLVGATAACSSGDGDDPSGDGDDARDDAGADCSPARVEEPTDGALTFTYAGQERSYLLALPEGYDGTTAAPLLFAFHGHGGSKEVALAASELDPLATRRGYVVVFPDAVEDPAAGGARHWAYPAGDDFGFVAALITDLGERLCIDDRRVYAAGHSDGSAFTGFLSCQAPYPWAAVAMVAAFIPSTCPADVARPSVLSVHGTADPGVPYEGGNVAGGPVVIPPVLETLDAYRDAYGCDPTATEDELQPGVDRKLYSGCAGGAEVAAYAVVGGGHEWPKEPFAASEAILDFFDEHPRPEAPPADASASS